MTTLEMTRHVADETLAAFADGRLRSPEQIEVINHLSSCDECRNLFDLVASAQQEGVIESTEVVRPIFGRPAALIGAAAAAAVVVVILTPATGVRDWIEFKRTGGTSNLVQVANTLEERTVEARLAGFPHKRLKPTPRGEGDQTDTEGDFAGLKVRFFAAKVLDQKSESAKVLHAQGLSYLMLGEYDLALSDLQTAVEKTGSNNAVMLNDLAAAHLARFRHTEQHHDDPMIALQAAEKSWAIDKTPDAAWNRALAIEYAGRNADAIRAWQEYIKLDPSSPWTAEAESKIAFLRDTF